MISFALIQKPVNQPKKGTVKKSFVVTLLVLLFSIPIVSTAEEGSLDGKGIICADAPYVLMVNPTCFQVGLPSKFTCPICSSTLDFGEVHPS